MCCRRAWFGMKPKLVKFQSTASAHHEDADSAHRAAEGVHPSPPTRGVAPRTARPCARAKGPRCEAGTRRCRFKRADDAFERATAAIGLSRDSNGSTGPDTPLCGGAETNVHHHHSLVRG
jgi:hypothetical protein